MTLFKFKSLKNFDHTADILCKNRFYASQFTDLNDPMEGTFDYLEHEFSVEYLEFLKNQKLKTRICSFSKTMNNILLWAHYADSFRGICIEVDVVPHHEFEIVEVEYESISPMIRPGPKENVPKIAKRLLSYKNSAWKYEKEFRLLTNDQFITPNIEIKAIYFGLRTSDIMKATLDRLVQPGVKLYNTRVNPQTNKIEAVDPYV